METYMTGLNRATLLGNLGKDVDLQYLQGGKAVAKFSLAVNESWKDQDGNGQERTEWFNCVCWGRTAEIANQFLHKGSKVYVEGKIQTRSWDKDGQKHYATEIVVNSLVFLDGKRQESASAPAEAVNTATDETDGLPF
jgi:single-strand DNA-binding protein